MAQIFANNLSAVTSGAITALDVSITLQAGQGAAFPAITGGDYMVATLIGITGQDETSWEVIHITGVTGDVLTVTRAQEGTAGFAWSSGTRLEVRMTAGIAAAFEATSQATQEISNPFTAITNVGTPVNSTGASFVVEKSIAVSGKSEGGSAFLALYPFSSGISSWRINAQSTGDLEFQYAGTTTYFTLNYDLVTPSVDVGVADFSVNTDNLFVDSSAGNVGIGTNNPQSELHIEGSTPQLSLQVTSDAQSGRYQYMNTAGTVMSVLKYDFTDNSLRININGEFNEAMRIDNAGEVGIGTTNPLRRLHVDSNGVNEPVRLESGNDYCLIEHIDNTGPAINVGSVQGNFIIRQSGNNMLRIDSGAPQDSIRVDNAGLVGIGESNPQTELHVSSASPEIRLQDSDGTNQFISISESAGASIIQCRNNTTNGVFQIRQWDGTTVSTAMYIDSNGDVGLGGNTNPGYTLDVTNSNNAFSPAIRLQDNGDASSWAAQYWSHQVGGDFLIYMNEAGQAAVRNNSSLGTAQLDLIAGGSGNASPIIFKTNTSTEVMRITSVGDVAIGTNTTAARLTASLDGAEGKVFELFGSTSGDFRGYSLTSSAAGGFSGALWTHDISSGVGVYAWAVDGAEKMRITADGSFYIGKTLNDATTQGASYVAASVRQNYVLSGSTSATQMAWYRNGSASPVGSISTTSTGTSFNVTSDERLKENIVDAPSASDDIDAIKIRSFDWKANGEHQLYGVIAQELEPVVPMAVSKGTGEDVWAVDYSKLVPLLVKEIQELRTRVAELEKK